MLQQFPVEYDRENKLQKDCQDYLEYLGEKGVRVSLPYKTHGNRFTMPGVSDILVCIYGIFCALECKVKDRKATQSQIRYLRSVRNAGGIGEIIRHPLDIEGVVKRAFEKAATNLQGRGEGKSST